MSTNKIAGKLLLLTLLFSLLMQPSFAQKEISNFHYSNTGISYNSGNPQTIPGVPSPNSELSIATLSDSIGNVQFDFCFTNPNFGAFRTGLVYDKNYQVMPGSNLFGPHYLYGPTALVAPVPSSNSKFYLFYQANQPFPVSSSRWVLKYAVVDMALNSGLGNVVSADNPIDTTNTPLLLTPYTLVQQRGSDNFWVVTCKPYSDTFYSRFVGSAGVNNNKVISKAGSIWFANVSNFSSLVTSPDGSMIAGARTGNLITEYISQVFYFNGQTGNITDKVSTKILGSPGIGSPSNTLDVLEFSPDNRLLFRLYSEYIIFNGRCIGTYANVLEQYNLCYPDSTSLTQYTYAKYFICTPYQFYIPRVVLNKKMHLSLHYGIPKYGSIDFPNHIGDSYNFNLVPLPPGLQSLDTRQFYHAYVQKAIKNSIFYTGGCYPDSLHFSITRDTTARVDWNFGDPASGINNTASTVKAAHKFSAPGMYTVTAKIFNASNLLIDSVNEIVERKDPTKRLLYPLPTDTVLCEGSSLIIKPHCINGIFVWGEGNGTPTQNLGVRDSVYIVNYSRTVYIKMIQNGCNGCEQTDSIKIIFEPKPRVSFGRYGSLCTGDSIQLDATFPGASHLWSTGDTTSFIWVKLGGTYWVNSIINLTGCASSDTITITEYPPVQVTLPNDTTLCQGEILILRPRIVNATSHTWNGTSYNGDTLVVTQSGTYWVTAININGCRGSDTINVTFNPSPLFTLGNDTTICGGTVLNLAPSPLQNNVNYLWSTNSTNTSISVGNPGAYWLKLVSTVNGCSWRDTINVSFKTLPNFTLGPDRSICEKDTIFLNATVAGAAGYRWNTGATTPVIKVFQTDIYWCDVNKDGCLYRDSVSVIVKPLPFVDLGKDATLCEGITLLLDATNPNSTYLWQDRSTAAVYLVKQKGKYYVTVNRTGCFARDSITVNYILKPDFTLGPDQPICNGMYITLNPGINNVNYLWQDGSLSPTYTVSQPGLYYLTATNNCGSKKDSIIFTTGVCKLYIPSAFTPNGDGENDVFKSKFGENVTEYHLQLFNRYGELVFESTDKNKGWDGTYKGLAQAQGVYIWVINFQVSGKPEKQLLKGSVLLIR